MRRLTALLIAALIAVPWLGANISTAAVQGGRFAESNYDFAHEVHAIKNSDAASCYVSALWGVVFTGGAGLGTYDLAGVTAWANLRLEGLAIASYATDHLNFAPTAKDLDTARNNLVRQMTSSATAKAQNCSGTAAAALAALPTGVQDAMVMAEAASEQVLAKVPSRISEDDASLRAFYNAHRSEYDKICVRVAVVLPVDVASFQADARAGKSPIDLVKKYSLDSSRDQNGEYGCFDATSNARDLVRGARVGEWGQPQPVNGNDAGGTGYYLLVSPMSRTTQPYSDAKVQAQVLSDVRKLNAGSASAIKEGIFARVGIRVNPQIGRFGNGQNGLGIYPPATPLSDLVPNGGAGLTIPRTD